jgi:Tc toxin complex TcA C-terminal TcB-binding domain/Neuraminidase-like domain/Putative peptidoglycan binding domain
MLGLKTGAHGPEVARLHLALSAVGYSIDGTERARRRFGPSTAAALRALRRDRGLPERGDVDETILAVLIETEVGGGEANPLTPSPPAPPPPAPSPTANQQGLVTGRVVDRDGAAVANLKIELLSVTLKASQTLASVQSGRDGRYSLAYKRLRALNLEVRALDDLGEMVAASQTLFASPSSVEIDLTTAPDGVIRTPSLFATLRAAVSAALDGIAFGDLQETSSAHQVQFLAQAIGQPFEEVASLYVAHKLGQKNGMSDQTLFGLFQEGLPANLQAALGASPASAIDDAFDAQILSVLLNHSQAVLSAGLTAAVQGNVLPASYVDIQANELQRLASLRAASVGAAPYVGGETPLSSLLAAGDASAAAQTAFIQAYADNNGALDATWETLGSNPSLTKADVAALKSVLSAGELLSSNLPLVKDTLQRLANNSLANLGDLALLDEADWEARIREVDPNATSIPQVLPNDTAADRITRFAKALAGVFAARYPTTAFRGALMKAADSPFREKDALIAFLSSDTAFDLHTSNIDRYLATNKVSLAAAAVAELKTAQRLHRVAPFPAHVVSLLSAGYSSAQGIYFKGRAAFLKRMTGALGDTQARKTFARAQMTYAASLTLFARHNGLFNFSSPGVLSQPAPDPVLLTNLPDLQALFGSMDFFQCADCQSITSPAAYLVDLLQYLTQFDAQVLITNATDASPIVITCTLPHGLSTGATVTISGVTGNAAANGAFTVTVANPTSFSLNGSHGNGAYKGGGSVSAPGMTVMTAWDALFLRRPEIQYVGLSCDNTNIVIPYIDLVNEILERAVAAIAPPNQAIETVGTTAERAALPQQTQPAVASAAYAATKSALFPLTLPFDQDFARTTAYLAGLGGGRAALLSLFAKSLPASTIAEAGLGVNAAMSAIITKADSATPWLRWGVEQNPSVVIDPKTREPYSPNPADWIHALNMVPLLMSKTGLTLQQVFQLLEVAWVTRNAVTLEVGATQISGVKVLSADTDLMVFTGLTGEVLDRINRFVRLWGACGLQMWELDWVLDAAPGGGAMDENFLIFLNDAVAVSRKLKLSIQETLSFWAPIGTRDVVSHLGDEDVVIPSTYTNVFLNPAVAANSGDVFTRLTQAPITGASNAKPIVVTTATPHGLTTKMVATLVGVTGNTAANGAFVVTVVSPASFSLNKSAGNHAWTGGGFVTGPISASPPSILSSGAQPTPQQIALTAALGLDAQDVTAIIDDSGTAPTLNLATLGTLLRYQRLATSLSLDIADLIAWIRLTGQSPFTANPADTWEFLHRLSVLQGVGLSLADLEYLLLGQSGSQSALQFTPAQTAAALQTIGDAVAKTTAAAAMTLAAVTPGAPVTAATAKPHGLTAGAQVFISGVAGPVSANGLHTIALSPKSATAFTLDGTSDATPWTGGGAIVTDPAALLDLIQASLVATLAGATNISPAVIGQIVAAKPFLTLDFTTVDALLANPTVDPAQFPQLASVVTQAAMAASMFTALGCTAETFAFVITNAAAYGLLDPTNLPVGSTQETPYLKFEALLRALTLQKRQIARTPKLSDVLSTWAQVGGLPADVATAVGGPSLTVTGASGDPILITTSTTQGLSEGARVSISGVQGNMAANGSFTISVQGQPANAFILVGSSSSGVYAGGGIVVSLSAPALAFALNAAIADVMAIATTLKAQPPALADATRPGTLADMSVLTAIAAALDVARAGNISGAALVQVAAAAPDGTTAAAAMGAMQARYPQSAWLGAVKPVEDSLRQARRDALVAWMLGPGTTTAKGAGFLTSDDIYNYYLIDPEMCPCGQTTRLLQPSLAIQQFVQQAFLNLTFGSAIDTTNRNWSEWSWRQQYRLWQANREVFLYPENYVLPELRANASLFFTELENDIAQINCDATSVDAAMENYLRKLVAVSRLRVAALYNEVERASDGATVLHVFARTQGTPPQWYYRTRTTPSPNWGASSVGAWSAWTQINVDISGDNLMPVVWDGKLYLFWATFKLVSEKAKGSDVPTSGGGSSQTAQKFTAVQIAVSECSAGQWQAKRTYDQKMFFKTDDPDNAFTFKAVPQADLSLSINVYFNDNQTSPFSLFVAQARLLYPDAPLQVTQASTIIFLTPDLIDTGMEPTYLTVQQVDHLQSNAGSWVLMTNGYNFNGQVLAANKWWSTPSFSPTSLHVTRVVLGGPATVELLSKIVNPAIVAPHQELDFDSSNPFFVYDNDHRCYLVDPLYYAIPSSVLLNLGSGTLIVGVTAYRFSTFYHPYARTFMRELETGGVPALMNRQLQLDPATASGRTPVNFKQTYGPQSVAKPYPGDVEASPIDSGGPDQGESWLDFDPGLAGAYSLYNWELFYHIPMYIAAQLMQNRQFKDAMTWLEYIFNPTDDSGGAAPQRFWQMAPFHRMQQGDWTSQQIDLLLENLAVDKQQDEPDPAMSSAIGGWMSDPYDPHKVASTRISSYGKATVMKTLDLLLAQGDAYYTVYTAENVSLAEQCYVLGSMLLGEAPSESRLLTAQQTAAPTYASLNALDAFSNSLVQVENIVIAPEPPQSLLQGSAQSPSLPALPSTKDQTFLFCIPPNAKMLGYWGQFAQRLYNIRHCLNLQGVSQPLPLYAPPINPMAMVAAAFSGATGGGAAPPAPIYRFAVYLERALGLANEVRGLGEQLLATLEKKDAETLAAMRASQELAIQTSMLDLKNQQVTEASDQIVVLQNQWSVTQMRQQFYSSQPFMNAWETTSVLLQAGALIANGVAAVLDLTAGLAYAAPAVTGGAAGFGGSPVATVTWGGENVGRASMSAASVSRTIAGILSESASMAAMIGGFQHRQDEWTLQANLAKAELTQTESAITAAQDRLTIANTEVTIQNAQIANAQAISDFLTGKYTNAQLYSWMSTQLTTVYTQAYQLAVGLALQAQNAYSYELGRPNDVFIQPSYWTSQYKGLTAGDGLLFDLRRMESQFLANNVRELEITKSISLALTQPLALTTLLQIGACAITLDESLFDHDCPGHYFRRLRSAALTIPCVTGPYTGVHASLSLDQAYVRTLAPSSPYQSFSWQNQTPAPTLPTGMVASPPLAATPVIVTSSGQNDAGLFDVNLRDERWLPFEGQGAVSSWTLTLDPRDNDFDLSTVTDVILHVRYTARAGGDAETVRKALQPPPQRSILVSVHNTFSNAYYAFFNPRDPTATLQTLTVPLASAVFPFSNLGAPQIAAAEVFFALAPQLATKMSGISISGECQAATASASAAVAFTPVSGTMGDGVTQIAALSGALTLPPKPGAFTLTVPLSGVQGPLTTTTAGRTLLDSTLFEDIFLLLSYSLG